MSNVDGPCDFGLYRWMRHYIIKPSGSVTCAFSARRTLNWNGFVPDLHTKRYYHTKESIMLSREHGVRTTEYLLHPVRGVHEYNHGTGILTCINASHTDRLHDSGCWLIRLLHITLLGSLLETSTAVSSILTHEFRQFPLLFLGQAGFRFTRFLLFVLCLGILRPNHSLQEIVWPERPLADGGIDTDANNRRTQQ